MDRAVVAIRRRGEPAETDFEVPVDVPAAELVEQIARALGEGGGQSGLELRSVSLGRALYPEETLQDAGLFDGTILVLARASDPVEARAANQSLLLANATTTAVIQAPPPPELALALPPDSAPKRPLWPIVVAVVAGLALLGLGTAWFLTQRAGTSPSPTPTATPVLAIEPAAQPTQAVAVAPPPQIAAPTAQVTPDEQAAWRDVLARLDTVWGTDWQAAIGLLQAFHTQYPTQVAATDKLYAALVEYGRALRDAGATSAASDAFDQAVRLQPQRIEAREELAAMAPPPTPAPEPTQPPAPAPLVAPTVARAAPPPPQPQPQAVEAPPTTPTSCDVASVDFACPLADGSQVQSVIAAPDGRHFYWFGVPVPNMQFRLQVTGPACPCTLAVFSDAVDEGQTPIATASAPDTASPTVLDALMPDPGPYLVELAPTQGARDPSLSYTLVVDLRAAPQAPPPEAAPPTEAAPATLAAAPIPVTVPPVVGRSPADAAERLRSAGLASEARTADRFSPNGAGTVAAQDPPAGATVAPGAAVTIFIASGTVLVPNVIGLPEQQAWNALHDAGFAIDTRHMARGTVPAGQTATTIPPAGSGANAGSTVILVISQGGP